MTVIEYACGRGARYTATTTTLALAYAPRDFGGAESSAAGNEKDEGCFYFRKRLHVSLRNFISVVAINVIFYERTIRTTFLLFRCVFETLGFVS